MKQTRKVLQEKIRYWRALSRHLARQGNARGADIAASTARNVEQQLARSK